MKNIAIIGAGAVGSSIALASVQNTISVSGIYSANRRTAGALAKKVRSKPLPSLAGLISSSDVVFIAVPDDQIESVVVQIASLQDNLSGKSIVHTSGAITSDVLLPLRSMGASTGSFHPLQTFVRGKDPLPLKNICVTIEGDRTAVKQMRSFIRSIGAKVFVISKKNKPLYHIAAVFASNYHVTLLSVVEQIARSIGIPSHTVWKMFGPLIAQTTENVLHSSPERALTGPISRGDVQTVQNHIEVLDRSKKLRHIVPLYASLGVQTVSLTQRKKHAR